jgi:hypothetical protein
VSATSKKALDTLGSLGYKRRSLPRKDGSAAIEKSGSAEVLWLTRFADTDKFIVRLNGDGRSSRVFEN